MPLNKLLSFTKDVQDLADKPSGTMTSAQLKAQFDAAPEELRVAFNQLIDDLSSVVDGDSGADNIAVTAIAGLTGATVQTVLEALKTLTDDNRAYLLTQIQGVVLGSIPEDSITQSKFATTNTAVIPFASATGIANTYAVTLNPAPTAYVEGMAISTKINIDSTGASTINVNGLGAIPVKKANGLNVSNLKANGIYTFRYSNSSFILQGEGGSGNLQPNQALSGFTFTNDDGEQVGLGDADLIPANILSGKNIFGVDGNLIPPKFAKGSVTSGAAGVVTVSNLTFQPDYVIIKANASTVTEFTMMDNTSQIIASTRVFGTDTSATASNVARSANHAILSNGFKFYAYNTTTYNFIAVKE